MPGLGRRLNAVEQWQLRRAADTRRKVLERNKRRAKFKGYGLKHLAQHFGVESDPLSIQDVMGRCPKSVPSAERVEYVHTSQHLFPIWVDYSTRDALYTKRLYDILRGKLEEQIWTTEVAWPMLSQDEERPPTTKKYPPRLHMWNFYTDVYRPFGELLNDMEVRGVPLDVAHLAEIERLAASDEQTNRDRVDNWVNTHLPGTPQPELINLRSPHQLRQLLFGGGRSRVKNSETGEVITDTRSFEVPLPTTSGASGAGGAATARPVDHDTSLNHPLDPSGAVVEERPPRRSKSKRSFLISGAGLKPSGAQDAYSPTGWPKTARTALESLRENCSKATFEDRLQNRAELLDAIIQAKQASAMLAYFIRPLQFLSKSGRVHPSLVLDTATGRLACRAPNLQNQPALERDSYRIRAAVRAEPGKCLVVCDFSQLELRVGIGMGDLSWSMNLFRCILFDGGEVRHLLAPTKIILDKNSNFHRFVCHASSYWSLVPYLSIFHDRFFV